MQDRYRDAPTKSAAGDCAAPRTRRGWRRTLLFAPVLLVPAALGGVSLQRYSESDAFCGLACHRAMAPQHQAHRDGSHANVRCVECHIGSGAMAHVVAKVRGVDQLWGMLTHSVSLPIRMPYRVDEPMRPRCERCHDLGKLPEVKRIQALRFGYDGSSRAQSLSVTLRIASAVGRDDSRHDIGWHMRMPHQVSYVASDDAATEIPWVQVRRADGAVTTYVSRRSKTPEPAIAAMPRRTMDCTDCHNRVGHRLPLPDAVLDQALQNGTLSRMIPDIKRSMVQALWAADKGGSHDADAENAIRDSMMRAYRSAPLADTPLWQAELNHATALAKQLSAQTLYGSLGVGWGTYADRMGHRFSAGCFRCHDGQHVSAEGKILTNDCASSCHTAPTLARQEPEAWSRDLPRAGSAAWHPYELPILDLKIEGHDRLLCANCHADGHVPARACEDCHHPPGI